MDIIQKGMSFDSCVQDARIFARIIEPADSSCIKAVLQISHGMAEHSLLYLDFARYLAEQGFMVVINDHLGHGKSVSTGEAYGYFGTPGCTGMVKDMYKLTQLIRQKYFNLPYFLLGHSMGSFLARSYITHYGAELTAAIFLGTCGGLNRAALSGKCAFADNAVKRLGKKAHYALFSKLSTVHYNKFFAPNRTANDWLSRDEAEVDRYENDPLCGFDLTVSGYRDILYLQAEIEAPNWYRSVPDIPLLFASGTKDPVGDFGKGVKKVVGRLNKAGRNAQLILYQDARHELLREINRQEVYRDILQFMESNLSQENPSHLDASI